jgi:hypothetical protein
MNLPTAVFIVLLLFYFEYLVRVYKERRNQERKKRKAPRGKSEFPWSLHIRSFWKTHFINPPEVQSQVIELLN